MKIGIFCSGSNPVPPKNYGGVQAVNYITAEALLKYGHEVYLFAPTGSVTSGNLIVINNGWGNSVELLNVEKFLSKYVDKLDILIDTSAFGIPSRKWKDLPYICRLGGDTKKKYCKNFDRNIIFPSYAHANFHNQNDCSCGIRRKEAGTEYKVVYKPVCFYDDVENLPKIKKEKGGYYLYIGLIQEHKGTHFAVEFAMKANVRLRIVGPIGNHNYFNTKIQPFLNDKITYESPATFKTKWTIIQNAIATIFPTNCHEGQPNVPMESLLCGVPVIGFNKDVLNEIIDDNITGLLCNDVDEMVERYKDVFFMDKDTCRQKVLEKFSVEKYINEYLLIINDVVKGKRWI